METLKVPLPLEKATGMLPQPEAPVKATSLWASPLKSPTSGFAFKVAAQTAKLTIGAFVTLKVPLPLENATGMLPQPEGPVNATSVRPSPLKSPASGLAFKVAAQTAKLTIDAFVTLKVPLPLENATGMLPQPDGPVNATSVRPSPLKSPASGFALTVAAQLLKLPTPMLVTANTPTAKHGLTPKTKSRTRPVAILNNCLITISFIDSQ